MTYSVSRWNCTVHLLQQHWLSNICQIQMWFLQTSVSSFDDTAAIVHFCFCHHSLTYSLFARLFLFFFFYIYHKGEVAFAVLPHDHCLQTLNTAPPGVSLWPSCLCHSGPRLTIHIHINMSLQVYHQLWSCHTWYQSETVQHSSSVKPPHKIHRGVLPSYKFIRHSRLWNKQVVGSCFYSQCF